MGCVSVYLSRSVFKVNSRHKGCKNFAVEHPANDRFQSHWSTHLNSVRMQDQLIWKVLTCATNCFKINFISVVKLDSFVALVRGFKLLDLASSNYLKCVEQYERSGLSISYNKVPKTLLLRTNPRWSFPFICIYIDKETRVLWEGFHSHSNSILWNIN